MLGEHESPCRLGARDPGGSGLRRSARCRSSGVRARPRSGRRPSPRRDARQEEQGQGSAGAAHAAEAARQGARGARQLREGAQGVPDREPARRDGSGDDPRHRRRRLRAQGLAERAHQLPEGADGAQRGRRRAAHGRLLPPRQHQARAEPGAPGDQQLREGARPQRRSPPDARGAGRRVREGERLEAGRRYKRQILDSVSTATSATRSCTRSATSGRTRKRTRTRRSRPSKRRAIYARTITCSAQAPRSSTRRPRSGSA
jgi:hypothetical protein